MATFRAVLAVYIFCMGGMQFYRTGSYVFKFYTIWNWWLLGLYFALAAAASSLCARAEASAAAAASKRTGTTPTTSAAATANSTNPTVIATAASADSNGAAANDHAKEVVSSSSNKEDTPPLAALRRATGLSRACHALFLMNSATVIIVDVVCWGLLYPMLARGPQTPEIQRMIKRLLLTFTSYNQHGLNALYIYSDLFLNRHRLAFHAVGPLGLWSMLYAMWAHTWHAMTGKWLYPFLDTSKPWAPVAYLGLYLTHWAAFGLVALLYRAKAALYRQRSPGGAVTGKGKGKGKVE